MAMQTQNAKPLINCSYVNVKIGQSALRQADKVFIWRNVKIALEADLVVSLLSGFCLEM